MFAVLAYPVDLVGNGLQPRPAILVGQGKPGTHLLDIAFRMKPVAVLASPVQPLGELAGNGALARAGHAHDNERAGRTAGFIGHENSPAGRRYPRAIWSRPRNARGPPADPPRPIRGSESRACPCR